MSKERVVQAITCVKMRTAKNQQAVCLYIPEVTVKRPTNNTGQGFIAYKKERYSKREFYCPWFYLLL